MTALFGWTAVTLGLVGTAIQWRRIATEGVAGVSLATWVLFAYMGCFWTCYGIVAHSPEVVLGSLIVLPLQGAILVRLRPWAHWGVVARALTYFVVLCVAPTVLFGWRGGVVGTGVAMTVNRAPQLLALIRQPDAEGVSAASWYVGALGTALWIAYYVGVHLWAALLATTAAGLANLAIALLASWRHAQARDRFVAREVFAH